MSAWERFDHAHREPALRGVWRVAPDDPVLPAVYADPARGEVDFPDNLLTPDQARAFAAYLVEAAALAEGRVTSDAA